MRLFPRNKKLGPVEAMSNPDMEASSVLAIGKKNKNISTKEPATSFKEHAIGTKQVTSFDSGGYDSLSKFVRPESGPGIPHEQGAQDDETESTKKGSSNNSSGLNHHPLEGRPTDKKTRPPKSSSHHGRGGTFDTIPILSISTDRYFTAPGRSQIMPDESSCISAITLDSANFDQHLETANERHQSRPRAKKVICLTGTGKRDHVDEIIGNHSQDCNNTAGGGVEVTERIEPASRGKLIGLQKQNVSLKEVNLKLMLQLSSSSRQETKSEISSESKNPGLRKVSADLSSNQENTTATENSSSVNEDTNNNSDTLRSLDLILQLEQQNAQMFSQLQEAEHLHAADLKHLANVQIVNAQQKETIKSLEQQLEESNQSIMQLECNLETIIDELVELRNHQEEEKIEFQKSYDQLKQETDKTIALLEKQLMEYQSKGVLLADPLT